MEESMEIINLNVVEEGNVQTWKARASFRTKDGAEHRLIVSAPFIPEQAITGLLGALRADAKRVLDDLYRIARAERLGS